MNFAPLVFRETRLKTIQMVEETLYITKNLTDINSAMLRSHPNVLAILRMSTCPPIAVDRLIGLANVSSNLVKRMEQEHKLPTKITAAQLHDELNKISSILDRMLDRDLFDWLSRNEVPSDSERYRAATIIADRLCSSLTNPILRNAQEQRQLIELANWLTVRGYRELDSQERISFKLMPAGTFSFRLNVPVQPSTKIVNIPIDIVVMPIDPAYNGLPVLIEAKSAGDFANVNKRRKEEAIKMHQLRMTYGDSIQFILFLCGYFDDAYLGYEAAEGIDWVWEHRIDDLSKIGL